jgi:hypothetical protein
MDYKEIPVVVIWSIFLFFSVRSVILRKKVKNGKILENISRREAERRLGFQTVAVIISFMTAIGITLATFSK